MVSTIRLILTLRMAGCLVLSVDMGQMRPRKDCGALKEGEGFLSEIEWVPGC